VTQAQFVGYLRQTVEDFDAVELYPHYPPLPRHCYCHPPPGGGDGRALREPLRRFKPATLADNDLILGFFLTLFWGGRQEQRPAWLTKSDDEADPQKGRGSGKTTLFKMASRLVGG
jgi:hypothetical protein